MKLGIRAKLILTLFLASVLPLTLGIISLEFFGYRTFQNNQGRVYRLAAAHLARNLSLTANAQIEKLADWTRLSAQAQKIHPLVFVQKRLEKPETIEKNWTKADASSSVLRVILDNELSRELRAFQKLNPTFGEIFVTDERGLVIAATNKTSDYLQADELWWQRASRMQSGQAWLEGIAFDPSAQLYSLNASLPIRDSSGKLRGVVKGVLNASQLFSNARNLLADHEARYEVVLTDGRVLARFFEENYAPFSARISPEFFTQIKAHRTDSDSGGWLLARLDDSSDRRDLVAFAPLKMQGVGAERVPVLGLAPMYVLVYNDVARVLAPVRWQLWQLGLGGGLLLLGVALLGLYVADRKIIVPLGVLGKATRSLSQTASLGDTSPSVAAQEYARRAVQQCRDIQTRDEIEQLAGDFAVMGERVLEYHRELEREIANKTGEIQRDLQMAREFQEALLPRDYPSVPDNDENAASLRLHFHHVYEPTLSVGGDFFDVFKLSDHQAGVFIADVMGHGARSALVTAILRTLLQDLSSERSDPAELMRLVNHHFFDIVQNSRQFVFVSAFCLVIDAQNRVATYASAGHPSPLLAEANSGRVISLLSDAHSIGVGRVSGIGVHHTDAALGVARDSSYHRYSRQVTPGDAFLLYTDGIVEAPDAQGEEFGMTRLKATVARHLSAFAATRDITVLTDAVMRDVNAWMQGVASPDDICLVAVSTEEAKSGNGRPEPPVTKDPSQNRSPDKN
jgi:serine phosphatase RsbU (regulator of sigma subunit)